MRRQNEMKILLQQLERAKESAVPLEKLLSRSEAELQRSPEMETLEMLVGYMALYFGNVFDAVTSYGKILQVHLDHDDPRRTYAQSILNDAKTGKRLIENLLYKRRIADLRLLTLDRFIRGLAPLLSRIVEKRIKLRTVRYASDKDPRSLLFTAEHHRS